MLRSFAKALAHGTATVLVAPLIVSYWLRSLVLGADRALEGSSQTLSLIPGLCGQYCRRAFLMRVLAACGPGITIGFGAIFSQAQARLGPRVYVGPYSSIGLACIEADVLIANGVSIPSGRHTHGSGRLDLPIREQTGRPTAVHIGRGAWIGSGAVVMADIGRETIVGAGSVVTRPLPDGVVAAGVPARVIRARADRPAAARLPG